MQNGLSCEGPVPLCLPRTGEPRLTAATEGAASSPHVAPKD